MKNPVRTSYVNPPIPYRDMDWFAQWTHHDGEDTLHGSGKTELDAVLDLFQNSMDEDESEDVVDLAVRFWKQIRDASD